MGNTRTRRKRKPGGGRKPSKPEYSAAKNLAQQMKAAADLYTDKMSLQAIAACTPARKRCTCRPVASAIILPVVPVATNLCWLKIRQYAVQNCTISSFLESCAISAIVIGQPLLCFASGHFSCIYHSITVSVLLQPFFRQTSYFFRKKAPNFTKRSVSAFQRFISLQLSKASCPAGAVS